MKALKYWEFSYKELPSIKIFISERMLDPEIMNNLENIREQEKNWPKKNALKRIKNSVWFKRKNKTILAFWDVVKNGIFTMNF